MYRGLVAIKEVTKAQAANGPYLRMVVTDGEREFPVKYWQYPDKDLPNVEVVYQLVGTKTEYNGMEEVHVKRFYETNDNDLSRFRERPIDPQVWYRKYLGYVGMIQEPGVSEVIRGMIKHNEREVLLAPAAKKVHHAYQGGWLHHSVEVAEAALFLGVDLDLSMVLAGALLHDIGKLGSYRWKGLTIEETRIGRLHQHIPLGYGEWMLRSAERVNDEFRELVGHIILSHHGKMEWGSPVEPMTREAVIVHEADMVSSRKAIMTEALNSHKGSDLWTPKVFPLGVSLYAGESRRYRSDTREFIHEL